MRQHSRTDTEHTMKRRDVLGSLAALGTASVVGTMPASAADGELVSESTAGMDYYVYEPTWYDGGDDVPLLVALHGCEQTANGFAMVSQLNEAAEQQNFLVAYPQADENSFDCFRWFLSDQRSRGQGEAEQVAAITEQVISDYTVDESAVFLTGFSAGASMVTDLIVEYADIYAAAAPVAGLAYSAGEGEGDGATLPSTGTGQPVALGTEAYESMEEYGITQSVPTLVIQGTDDDTVDPVNAEEVAEQAVQTNDLVHNGEDDDSVDFEADTTENDSNESYNWTRKEYVDPDGNVLVVKILIEGLGHAWPGGEGGDYSAPDAPSANALMWEFFTAEVMGDTATDGSEESTDDGEEESSEETSDDEESTDGTDDSEDTTDDGTDGDEETTDEREKTTDDTDGGEETAGDDDQESSDDGTDGSEDTTEDTDGSEDTTEDTDESGDADGGDDAGGDASGPGFGFGSTITAVGGAGYLLGQRLGGDGDQETEQ